MGKFIGNTKSIDRELFAGEALCRAIARMWNSSLKGIPGGKFCRNAFIGFVIIAPVKYRPLDSSSLAKLLAEVRKSLPAIRTLRKIRSLPNTHGGDSVIG